MSSSDDLFKLNLMRMSPSRYEVLKRFAGKNPTRNDNEVLSRVLLALRKTVESNRRTEIRGFGVFTWRPFKTRLPSGKKIETHRLWFSSNCITIGRKVRV